MIDELKHITGRQIRFLHKTNTALFEWISKQTIDEIDISLSERIYIILHGKPIPCPYGNKKKLSKFSEGYRNCSINCQCCIENAKINRTKTNIKNFGVENSIHINGVQEKMAQTNMERYGHENASSSPIIRERVKKTNIERYGVTNISQNKNIRNKAEQTNLKLYGFRNVSQNTEVKEKIKKRNFELFDAENPFKNEMIKGKIKNHFNMKYNRNSHQQKNITDFGYETLLNEIKFKKILETKSLSEIAQEFAIGLASVWQYCQKYNIAIPASSYETAICSFLNSYNIKYKLHDRTVIKPLEIDILLENYKLGIEFCGLYWHSEINIPDKQYHRSKLEKMNAIGYRLITIFEDEWLYKRNIVERYLLNVFSLIEREERIPSIQKISLGVSKSFLDDNYIHGSRIISEAICYGAFINDELIGVMTMTKTTDEYELICFASSDKKYVGLEHRLLHEFIKEYDPKQIISYADRRWDDGETYIQLGFEKEEEIDNVNYWFVKRSRRYHHNEIKYLTEEGNVKTEIEIINEMGYTRIWDCGTMKFIWNKK